MAYQIKWRGGTAATWTSTNPVLSSGELGVENDTGKKKFGDGTTTWNSLSYAGPAGPAQTLVLQPYGDGSDGNATITASNTTSGPLTSGALTRDAYYNNLTISGSGSINPAGYKIFVLGTLNIAVAAANAIQVNGSNGGNASGTTGGVAGTAQTSGSIGSGSTAGAGAAGTTGTGAAGSIGTAVTGGGGASGATGVAGAGTNAAGAAGAAIVSTAKFIRRWASNFVSGVTLLQGGAGARGGPSGGGDGTNASGAGGAGGNGGGIIVIYAKNIIRSTSTAVGAISANGGNGGNASNGASAGATGGGSGGGGGGGGYIWITYQTLAGSQGVNILSANGGNGGSGGNGFGGNSISTGTGGSGGGGGAGGRIYLLQSTTGASIPFNAVNDTSAVNPPLFAIGGAGALGTLTLQNL